MRPRIDCPRSYSEKFYIELCTEEHVAAQGTFVLRGEFLWVKRVDSCLCPNPVVSGLPTCEWRHEPPHDTHASWNTGHFRPRHGVTCILLALCPRTRGNSTLFVRSCTTEIQLLRQTQCRKARRGLVHVSERISVARATPERNARECIIDQGTTQCRRDTSTERAIKASLSSDCPTGG